METVKTNITFEKELLIPHIIYQKNPIKAIKSKLGNDVNIISYTVSDALTTNEEFIVKVVYSAIDFSPFEIYKVNNVKRINTNSDKYIGEVVIGDTISYVKLSSNCKEAFVKINTLTQNITDDIVYYGDIITCPQDIMSNFCSAFCTVKLSYHGTAIKTTIPQDEPLNKIINMPVDGNVDKKAFDELQSMSHDYSRNYFDISYLKQQISNKVNVLNTKSQIKAPGIYSAENLTMNELSEILKKTKTGIFFMLSDRSSPYSFVYLPNHEMTIKPHLIDHMLIVMSKDIENIFKFNNTHFI